MSGIDCHAERPHITDSVRQKYGPQYRYVHTVNGVGPYGTADTVEVYDNGEQENWDDRRTVHVLNDKVLDPW